MSKLPTSQPSQPPVKPTPGESLWWSAFFYLSAAMAAMALVDLDAGRLSHGLGDAGVSCLMLSLMTQFPFVRAMVAASRQSEAKNDPKVRETLLREAERVRAAHPWADRAGALGWLMLFASLLLRASGA